MKPHLIFDRYLTDDTRNNRNLGISWFQEERGTHVRGFGLKMNHNITDRKAVMLLHKPKSQELCGLNVDWLNVKH